MSKESALSRYASSVAAIEDHVRENKSVFDAHRKLLNAQIDAENALRDEVAESGSGVADGAYTVTCTPQTQTVYDETLILGRLGITREKAIEDGLITVNQRPPRISIGRNKVGI